MKHATVGELTLAFIEVKFLKSKLAPLLNTLNLFWTAEALTLVIIGEFSFPHITPDSAGLLSLANTVFIIIIKSISTLPLNLTAFLPFLDNVIYLLLADTLAAQVRMQTFTLTTTNPAHGPESTAASRFIPGFIRRTRVLSLTAFLPHNVVNDSLIDTFAAMVGM
jgi:hypothetical protein